MLTKEYRLLPVLVREGKHAGSYATRTLRLFRPIVIALLIVAMLTSGVSAAVIRTNLTPPEARQLVRQTLQAIKPALYLPVAQVTPGALQMALDKGKLTATQYAQYYQVFVESKAPADQPEIAHLLSLPKEQQIAYSLQRLQQMGKLSAQEAQFFTALRAAPDDQVRAMAVSALESGSYGVLATAILQVAVDLSSIDPNAELEFCDAASSELHAQGFFKWLAGLVKSVAEGALVGALIGSLFGDPILGAVLGGIAAGAGYIYDTTGNGFKPGPNGEDCTGWPRPFPSF
jgi:hypothetical protein